jgi:hypothetical protein
MGGYTSVPRRGIVAASARLHQPGTKLAPTREWQGDAWDAYDITGQGRFVANSVANAISRCPLYIAKLDPDTGEILGPADDPRLKPFVASPLGTGPRRRENLRLCALNLFVAGEYYLIGEAARPGADGGRDKWYIVSSFDFDRKGTNGNKGFKVTRPQMAGGGTAVLIPGRDVICRVWTPHPKHATEADSPFRAALPDLAILATIRKREAAELDSRLTGAGIMMWPQSVDFGKGGVKGFTDKLIEHAGEIVSDPAHPNSLIPEMVTMNGEDIEKVRVINFWSEVSDALGDLTERKVLSLAQSMDAPVSMTLGTSEKSHWAEWLQAEETITTHYDPILSRNADALTSVYLHPGIERNDDGLNPDEYAYAFDTSPLRIRGDRLGDDINLWDRTLISDETLRTSAGRTDDDAPSEEETRIRFMRDLVKANPQLVTDPTVVALLGFGTPPVVIDQANGPAAAPAVTAAADEERPASGPPDQSGANPTAVERPALTAAANGLAAVANVAVVRALEVAGGRLVKTYSRSSDTDRTNVYTNLERPPEDNQITNALDGAWRSLPDHLATLGTDANVAAVESALDTYTRHLIRNRRPHNPAALAALLDLGGLA